MTTLSKKEVFIPSLIDMIRSVAMVIMYCIFPLITVCVLYTPVTEMWDTSLLTRECVDALNLLARECVDALNLLKVEFVDALNLFVDALNLLLSSD
jgi:hypothetical protein